MPESYEQYVIPEMTMAELFPTTMEQGEPIVNPRIVNGVAEGMSFRSADGGARVEIFPEWDATIGQIVYNAAGTEVFKILIDGTDTGDITIGDYASDTGILWDNSAGSFNVKGTLTATAGAIGGWTIDATSIYTGTEDHSGYTANAGDLTIYSDGTNASIHAKNFYIDATGILNCAAAVVEGAITTGASSSIDGQYLGAGTVTSTKTKISIRGWTTDIRFTPTDNVTVTWTSGDIELADGTTYSIVSGTTGTMSAKTLIYLDIDTSVTVLQITTTASTAVGDNKILVAVATNVADATKYAVVNPFANLWSSKTGTFVYTNQLATNAVTANEIVANTITSNKITTGEFITLTAQIKDAIINNAKISDLAVSKLTAGSIASQAIVLAITATAGDSYIAGGSYNVSTWLATGGFIFGFDDSDSDKLKWFVGDATTSWDWNVTTANTFTVKGAITVTAGNALKYDSGIKQADGTNSTADDILADGSTYKRITTNEQTGAQRAYADIDSSGNFIGAINPAHNAPVSGAGLYLGGDYLGYYDSSAWKTYMDSSGNFYLGGVSGSLQWNGTILSITGIITVSATSSGIASFSDAGDLATTNEADADVLLMTNAPAAAGADVTGSNTAADTALVNAVAAATVEEGGSKAYVWRHASDVTKIDGGDVYANSITVTQMTVTNLAALNADLGSITAGNITLDSSGYIKGGQTAFDTGTGFWLGYDGAWKFSIGIGGGTKGITWDNTDFIVRGDIRAGAIQAYGISADVYYSDDVLETASTSTTYVEKKEFTLGADWSKATLRVHLEVKNDASANFAYARIYKNDSPYGTERLSTKDSNLTAFNEDLVFEPGDTVQLMCKTDDGEAGGSVQVANFRILGTETPQKFTVTDTG